MIHSLESGRKSVLVRDAFHPVYSPTGHVLYGQTSGGLEVIMALPFSLTTMSIAGDAFPIAQHGIDPSVARDGTLIYPAVQTWPRLQLTWHERSGNRILPLGAPEAIESMALSPDGRSVAVNLIRDVAQGGIWILDIARGTKTRLTLSPQADTRPIWSPTGKEITFCSNRVGNNEIYTTSVDGSGEARLLIGGRLDKEPDDWSPDGRSLVFEMEDPATRHDLWILQPKPAGGYETTPFLRTPAEEFSATFSPNGQFLAYVSDESGRAEVYVRHFPDGKGVRQISVNGGTRPLWRKDGKELFFLEEDSLMAVPVAIKPALSIGQAKRLFKSPGLREITLSAGFYSDAMYGVSADGQRFLFPEISGTLPVSVIRVVESWFAEFKDREKSGR